MFDLLVIDDEPNVLYSLERGLQSESLGVRTARSGEQGLRQVRERRPDAVILDVRLPDQSGLDVFSQLRAADPRLPVIIITAFAATETAIEAMKRGAFEYLLKPVDLHQLKEVLGRAFEMSRLPAAPGGADPQAEDTSERIVGKSPPMQEVYKAIGRVAPCDVPVLITGESGTGKELVARALFQHGGRSAGPFVTINCAAIPESLLESELFGHEKGAFTGADRKRIGKFEQCHGGTLFLDEVGDMSPATQAKVLRLLQQQRFERLGSNETIQADVRVIAATNKDLEAEVEGERFRGDLLFRLNGFTIHLPPLRDRPGDLPLLLDHFLGRFNRSLGRSVRTIAPEARQCLERYAWPGNIRELQSVLRYAMIRAGSDVLGLDCFPAKVVGAAAAAAGGGPALDVAALTAALLSNGEADIYRRVSQAVDRVVLDLVLRHAGGHQVQASELLGISRTTLRARLRSLGVLPAPGVAEIDHPAEV